MQPIKEYNDLTFEQFENEIRPSAKPIVMRGFVKDWPVVKAALESPKACADYITNFANNEPQKFGAGKPEINGLYHYDENIKGLNFGWNYAPLAGFFNTLLGEMDKEQPASLALQALNVNTQLPGFEALNPRKFAPEIASPYMWISNSHKVATHQDPYENIACVVAGCRRFTLFPPEQTPNLYLGPFLNTPAGPPISMVHLTEPDFDKYPKFADAIKSAQFVDLYPGDALYIPYRWYHHVHSKTAFNILLIYWWSQSRKDIGDAWTALMIALFSIGNLPEDQRKTWRETFEYFVFQTNGDPWEHLPPQARDALIDPKSEHIEEIKKYFIRLLGQ